MTPEERAREIVFAWNREYNGWTERHRDSLLGMDAYEHEVALIAAAIREEREACAKLAEAHGSEWNEAYCDHADAYDPVAAGNMATGETAREIAAAIRARA